MRPSVRLLSCAGHGCLAALLLSSLFSLASHTAIAQAASDANSAASSTAGADDGTVSIGGQVVMRLRASAGGMSTQQRVDAIEDRLTKIVAVPDIKTGNVVVYTPQGKPPVIYVLGKRLITVDAATVKAAGGGSAKQLAIQWAKRLQQILPRVDIRLPNEPEPKVPANPPLTVTSDLKQVGGSQGDAVLRGKTVMRFRGIQPGGVTAAERADMLSDRLNQLANKLDTASPDAVAVAPADSQKASDNSPSLAKNAANTKVKGRDKRAPAAPYQPEQIFMGGKLVYTVTKADAKAAGSSSTLTLANSWAKNIRVALGMPPNGAPAQAATPAVPSTPPPPPPPSIPSAPSAPTAPSTPTAPGSPSQPATPSAPNPNTPGAPNTPAQPSEPATPASPTAPTAPPASTSAPAPSEPAPPAPPAPDQPGQPPSAPSPAPPSPPAE